MSDDVYQKSVQLHQKFQGKLGVVSLVPVADQADLALAYTPGVAEPCRIIAQDEAASFSLTMRGRTVAVVSDGSAVLGLGNIGPAAGMPVMEGKALLLKVFANVDAVPLVIDTQDTAKIIEFVRQIRPSFAGINLEDISAPRCFEVEDQLQDLGIPVFHDDQHGTAIVVTAALQNAAKAVNKRFNQLKVVIVGAGAAGLATARMLLGIEGQGNDSHRVESLPSVADVIIVDSQGAITSQRSGLNEYKQTLAKFSNHDQRSGTLAEVMVGADVAIGVSGPNLITQDMVRSMAQGAIVFAMANPVPEIMPDEALAAGAVVVATGRSDFPNQINNVLAFPGVFRGAIDGRVARITMAMKQAAAQALADLVEAPTPNLILPSVFDKRVVPAVAQAIKNA